MKHHPALLGLTVTGVVMAANSLLLGSWLMFGATGAFSETAGTAAHLGYQSVQLACVAGLSLLLPRLDGLAGRHGRSLPTGLLVLAGLAAFFDGGTRFVLAFVTPYLAAHAPELLDESPASILMVAMVSAWVAFGLALVAVGVAAYRRRVFSRAACVLLVVGALAIPAVGPLAGLLVGPALAWAAGSRLRTAQARPQEPDRVPVA